MKLTKEQKIIRTIKQGMLFGLFLPFAGPIITIIYAILALMRRSTKKTLLICAIVLSILYLIIHYEIMTVVG